MVNIKKLNELPDGSGSLSNDDILLFMDNPSGSGITKKISLSEIASAIGGGGGADTGDITFNGISIIGSGTGSGDGNNKGTIELVPDNTLYNNDQYLIVDPTAPNHVHLRAGGTQDNSNAELIVGGERTSILVSDISNNIKLTATAGTWNKNNAGSDPIGSITVSTVSEDGLTAQIESCNGPWSIPIISTDLFPTAIGLITIDGVDVTAIHVLDDESCPTEITIDPSFGKIFTPGATYTVINYYPNYSNGIWTFQNDGVLQLANGGIKFSDTTTQTTAAGSRVAVQTADMVWDYEGNLISGSLDLTQGYLGIIAGVYEGTLVLRGSSVGDHGLVHSLNGCEIIYDDAADDVPLAIGPGWQPNLGPIKYQFIIKVDNPTSFGLSLTPDISPGADPSDTVTFKAGSFIILRPVYGHNIV